MWHGRGAKLRARDTRIHLQQWEKPGQWVNYYASPNSPKLSPTTITGKSSNALPSSSNSPTSLPRRQPVPLALQHGVLGGFLPTTPHLLPSLHCCRPFVFVTLRAVCGDIARAAKTEYCQEPSCMVLARPTGTGRTQHSRASFFHTQLFYG